jgi:nitrate reductase gamma subunit
MHMEILYDSYPVRPAGRLSCRGWCCSPRPPTLFVRRLVISNVRYISLAADYFPLFLIMGIAFTGILMRYFTKVDIAAIKELTMGLVTFNPVGSGRHQPAVFHSPVLSSACCWPISRSAS